MKKVGAYLPGAYEEVVDVVDAYVLTEKVWLCYRLVAVLCRSGSQMLYVEKYHGVIIFSKLEL